MNTGNNLLFLIVAAMLGFMAISGIFGLQNLQKLSVTIKFPDEIYSGMPAQLTLQLASKGSLLPHFLLTLHVDGTEAAFPLLKTAEPRAQQVFATFTRRGAGIITRAAVSSPFPVNFFVRRNLLDLSAAYLVFPQPVPLPRDWPADDRNETGLIVQARRGNSGETESIGQYTGKEPLKQIHWKLSARHEDLLVKEMAAEQGKPVVIEPDKLPGGTEERLGHAAYLINSLMLEGRAVGLILGEKSIPPGISRGHRLKMLGELALHAPH